MGTSNGSRDKLGTGRSSGRTFSGPSSQAARIACRPSAEGAARSQRWAPPWILIETAWELQLDAWIEGIFAVRSGCRKWGVIRSGLGGC